MRAATILAVVIGALTPTSHALADATVAESFRARRLSEARMRLDAAIAGAHPVELGPPGNSLHLWSELLDLAECVPLTPRQRKAFVPTNAWEQLIGLARLERMRLRRTAVSVQADTGVASTLFDPSFFQRTPVVPPASAIRWPYAAELWDDEFPLPRENLAGCERRQDEALPSPSELMDEELSLTAALLDSMTPASPGWAAIHLQRAALFIARGDVDAALDGAEPLSRAPEGTLREDERDKASLLEAMRRDRADEREAALAMYDTLLKSPHLLSTRAFIESRTHAALAAEKRWLELVDRLPTSPPLDTETGRYAAWLRGRALAELGRDAELFDHARDVLRRSVRPADDPALSLLADLVHARLARAPFDNRVLEFLEALGPPRELYPRVERFARVALERGRHDQSKAALSWLLLHHEAAHEHPRYHSLLGRLAFESGTHTELRRWLNELSVPQERLLRVIPSSRRAAFWRERDRELLHLVSALVPRLPERSDRRWATVLADSLQNFLRDAPESSVHAPLTELYRTTRGLLAETDREWAERIGAAAPPLVLGEVVVARPEPHPPAPRAPPRLDEPRYLVRVPLGDDPSDVTAWLDEAEVRP